MGVIGRLRWVLISLWLLGPASGWAQEGSTDRAVSSRAAEFRAVTGPDAEQVPGGMLLIAAYAVVWLLVFAYFLRLGKQQARLATDVSRLEQSLARATNDEDDAADS